ncbi:MAG TPA: hypothetical protein PK200_18560, partial [Spirochaetota bacterium]|nr:hypothetical protein [Spirochaetota bacterium]
EPGDGGGGVCVRGASGCACVVRDGVLRDDGKTPSGDGGNADGSGSSFDDGEESAEDSDKV